MTGFKLLTSEIGSKCSTNEPQPLPLPCFLILSTIICQLYQIVVPLGTFIPKQISKKSCNDPNKFGAVVVTQLVERLPPTPEIHGSNPVISKLLSNICLL